MIIWPAIIVGTVTCYLFKLAGLSIPDAELAWDVKLPTKEAQAKEFRSS